MIRCKTVLPLIVQKTRFDRVLEFVATVLIMLAWFTASCLYVLDNQYFLYFLFAALSTMLAGIMLLTVRFPDKLRIKMHVDLGGDAIALQSRLVLRCIRWIGVTFAMQAHFLFGASNVYVLKVCIPQVFCYLLLRLLEPYPLWLVFWFIILCE